MDPTSARAFSSVFRPVRGLTAFEDTMESILRAIALGVVEQGARLPGERELAGLLGVSRATLREALDALREIGLVESRRGRTGGSFVARAPVLSDLVVGNPTVSRAKLEDVLTLRRVVGVGAAEVAASRRLADEEVQSLRHWLAASLAAPLDTYRQADSRLHMAFAEASGSDLLIAAVAEAEVQLHRILDATPLIASKLRHSNLQHEAIVDAICRRRPVAARLAVETHLDGTAAMVRGFFGIDKDSFDLDGANDHRDGLMSATVLDSSGKGVPRRSAPRRGAVERVAKTEATRRARPGHR